MRFRSPVAHAMSHRHVRLLVRCTPDTESFMNEHLSLSTAVTLTPRRSGLRANGDNTVEGLLRVQAPDGRRATRVSVRPRPLP